MSKIALEAIPGFKVEIVKLKYKNTPYTLGGASGTDVLQGDVNISQMERDSKEATKAVNL